MQKFLRDVLKRLDIQEVRDSLLRDEWASIEEADGEERDFCEAAAALGADPYELSDAERRLIIEVSRTFPTDLAT